MKAPTMEEELNSFFVVFELMGLQNFSLKSLTAENAKTRPAIVRLIYFVILFLLNTFIMTTFFFHDEIGIQEEVTAKNVLMYAIQHSMNFGLIMVLLTGLVQSFTSTCGTKRIFLNFKEIIKQVQQEFGIVIDFSRIRKASWRRLSVMLIFYGISHVTTFLSQISSASGIVPFILGIFPIVFLLMIVYKYIFYVGMVNHQLQFLRKMLADIFKLQSSKATDISLRMNQINYVMSPDDPMRKLRAIRTIYNLIYENGAAINDGNGLTMLTLLICLVTSLTVSGYQIFVLIVGGLPKDGAMGKLETNLNSDF